MKIMSKISLKSSLAIQTCDQLMGFLKFYFSIENSLTQTLTTYRCRILLYFYIIYQLNSKKKSPFCSMCNISQMLKASIIRDNRSNMRKKIISEMSLPLQIAKKNLSFKRNISEGSNIQLLSKPSGKENLIEFKYHLDKKNEFLEKYEILEKIGQGANSTVYKCKSKKSNEIFAVKIMRHRDQELIARFKYQFEMNQQLVHDSIIKHQEFIIDNATMTSYSILEYCDYQNLKEELYSRPDKKFSEQQAVKVLCQILEVLDFLHSKGYAHRDIKPENVLYDSKNGKIKLVDFDTCKSKKETESSFAMWTKTGTLNYEAPEIFLNTTYSEKVDIWALGILAYELLTGKLPFYSQYSNKTIKLIISSQIDFQSLRISVLMSTLLKGLLEKDSFQRFSASEALELCSSMIN